MRILVTGFEPFGADPENASERAVGLLAEQWAGPHELVTQILPVRFADAAAVLRAAVERHRPDAVVAVGEAGGRAMLTPERRARNLQDARIPDNAGEQPRDQPIDDGPEWRDLPWQPERMVAELTAAGLPAAVSEDAGAFLCNRIAHEVAVLGLPGGFLHVPAVRTRGRATVGAETDETPPAATELDLDQLAAGLAIVVRAVLAGSG